MSRSGQGHVKGKKYRFHNLGHCFGYTGCKELGLAESATGFICRGKVLRELEGHTWKGQGQVTKSLKILYVDIDSDRHLTL